MKFFIFILYCALIDTTCCCLFTVENKKQQVVIERSYPGSYTEGSIQVEPECLNLRYTPDVKRVTDFRSSDHCNNMVPGLNYLENGCIQNFFYESFREYGIQQREKVLYLTCGSSHEENINQYRNYTVPSEIDSIVTVRKVAYVNSVLSNASIMKELENDAGFMNLDNKFLLSLPLLRSKFETIESAGYIGLIKQDFQARLRTDTNPNQYVLNKYNELPDYWREDTDAFYEFIMQFGTHVRDTSTFGGSLMLLISQRINKINLKFFDLDDILQVTRFLTQVINIGNDEDLMIRLIVHGGLPSLKDSFDWLQSTIDEPVPVNSTYIPLNEFLDKSNSSKSQSLAQFISFESDHQVYKKYSYQMEMIDQRNELFKFVKSKLSDQLQYICSSKFLNMVINDGIEAENNIKLDKFFFKFTTNETVHNNSLELIYKNTIPLIPKVCFTFNKKINDCSEPSLQLPSMINCLQLFENKNCIGKGTRLYKAIGMQTLVLHLNVMSAMLCDPKTDQYDNDI